MCAVFLNFLKNEYIRIEWPWTKYGNLCIFPYFVLSTAIWNVHKVFPMLLTINSNFKNAIIVSLERYEMTAEWMQSANLSICVCAFFSSFIARNQLIFERVKWVTETRRLNYVHADIRTKFHRYAFIWMSVIVRMYELIQSMAIVKIERKYLPMIFILSNYLAIRMPFSVFVCEFCKILCTF